MGLARKTALKVWDGFAKAFGAGLFAGLATLFVWAYGSTIVPTQVPPPQSKSPWGYDTFVPDKSYDFYPYKKQPKRADSKDGTWATDSATPYYDYIDTLTPKRVPTNKKGEVWGDYRLVDAKNSDGIYPESIDYFVPYRPQRRKPAPEIFVPPPAGDRT